MANSESEEEVICTPPEMRVAAQESLQNVLPDKSKKKYEKCYEEFVQWKLAKKAITSENCLLVFFQEIVDKYKPTTAWSIYSMLKSMIKIKEKIDISKFHSLIPKLKKHAVGHESKKAKVFTAEEIDKYLFEAPDEVHLANKVSREL